MYYPESSTRLDAIEISHVSALLAFTVVDECWFRAVDDTHQRVAPRIGRVYVIAWIDTVLPFCICSNSSIYQMDHLKRSVRSLNMSPEK